MSKAVKNLLQAGANIKRVITVSQSHYDSFRDHQVIHKCCIIKNGIPIREVKCSINSKKNLVCYIGALERSKGFHYLAKAWPLVKEKNS